MTTRHIAVLGAGIVGACTALALRKAGFDVSLVDPDEPGGQQAASFGNAGWLSPASVVPMSMPGMIRRVPGMLADPLGPLAIDWRALPRLAPWLLRFLHAGATVRRVEATARALRPLLESAPALHADLATSAGVAHLVRRDGLLYAFPGRADFEAEALAWRLRRDNGVVWTELDGDALRAAVPTLSPRYRFAAFVASGGHCTDPGAYVAALVRHAGEIGVRVVRRRAKGFRIEAGRLVAVTTDTASDTQDNAGEMACDGAVIAAGIHAGALARLAADTPRLQSERGYHVSVAGSNAVLSIPVQPSDTRTGITPMAGGQRIAGQVELCGIDRPPDWRRADTLRSALTASVPGSAPPHGTVSRWMGHRPSTPDGLPVIGPASATPDIVHAYGHGHVGMASAPMTARLVTALFLGADPGLDLRPYAAQRFNHWWPRPAAGLDG